MRAKLAGRYHQRIHRTTTSATTESSSDVKDFRMRNPPLTAVPDQKEQGPKLRRTPAALDLLLPWRSVKRLRQDGDASTFDRLLRSRHVTDLRLVVSFVTFGVFFWIATCFAVAYLPAADKLLGATTPRLQLVAAALAVGGAIVAWCYRTGNARLGIVDLLACEITTLCRVCIVVNLTHKCVQAFKQHAAAQRKADGAAVVHPMASFSSFESEDDYTPAFNAGAKDLQLLEFNVVTNITEFYTYWKAMRDAFRKLDATPVDKACDDARDPWRYAMRNVIYMQFLMFESARNSVTDLIEFEPAAAENTITILLSELLAYQFLLEHFGPADVRHARLRLRAEGYQKIVEEVCNTAKLNFMECKRREESGGAQSLRFQNEFAVWKRAAVMLDTLTARSKAVSSTIERLGKPAADDGVTTDHAVFA